MVNGIDYNGRKIKLELNFVADLPAFASIKFTKNHTGHFACTKCETEGEYISNTGKRGGRVTFPEVDAPLRTDEGFHEECQNLGQHLLGIPTQLLRIPRISMISNFIIDPMHCVFIGVTRKILHLWNSSRKSIKVYLKIVNILFLNTNKKNTQ